MRYEACDASPNFYRVRGYNKTIRSYLQYTVKSKLRYYEDNVWHIHRSQIVALTRLGYAELGYVQYGQLDEELQIRIATEKVNWQHGKKKTVTLPESVSREAALRELHLQPDAPAFMIKAAWRALAQEHHPDKGGDAEVFKKYLEAYNLVKE